MTGLAAGLGARRPVKPRTLRAEHCAQFSASRTIFGIMEGAAAEVAAGESSGTDYASSDDGAMPFSNEDHTDHFGTFSQEGDSFAPLVETPLTAVRRMLEVAGLKRSDRLIDVGCGDGRIVVEAAEHFGCDAVGIDLFDDRLGDAANLAAERKVTSKTRFLQADAREFDFTGFDVVVVFLLPAALAIILPKLKQCLASGARVASYWFPVDGLMCVFTDPSSRAMFSVVLWL